MHRIVVLLAVVLPSAALAHDPPRHITAIGGFSIGQRGNVLAVPPLIATTMRGQLSRDRLLDAIDFPKRSSFPLVPLESPPLDLVRRLDTQLPLSMPNGVPRLEAGRNTFAAAAPCGSGTDRVTCGTVGRGLDTGPDGTSSPPQRLDGMSSNGRGLTWTAAGRTRWLMQTDDSGALCAYAYGDDGTFLRTPVCFSRTSGVNTIGGLTTLTNSLPPTDGGVVGQYFTATNTGMNGGIGAKFGYNSAANALNFDVGTELYSAFNPTHYRPCTAISNPTCSGPGNYGQFMLALSPNDAAHRWGMGVAEWNIVNRGPDMGWAGDRGKQPVTGGLLIVPETSIFSDPGGGEGKNALYGFSVSRSGSNNSTGEPARLYNGYMCEPNSMVGIGQAGSGIARSYCMYATGDVTGLSARMPYSPLGWAGAWAHGLDSTAATFSDGMVVRARPGQSFSWTNDAAAAGITASGVGANLDIDIKPAGSGRVRTGTASLQIGTDTAATINLYLNAAPGYARSLNIATAGGARWQMGASSAAENGHNTGSNFGWYRYSDAGVYLGNPMNIDRASGTVSINNGAVVSSRLVVPFGAPDSARAPCTAGQIQVDTTYIYTCVATNTWHRATNGTAW